MQRILKITTDGSFTLFVPSLNEHFHSVHGAFTESNHIFIKAGFNYIAPHFEAINILEFGLGTGLNSLLTIQKSLEIDKPIFYHALEKFPVLPQEFSFDKALLSIFDNLNLQEILYQHWESDYNIDKNRTIHKSQIDFNDFVATKKYHLIYFDAFAPEIQPELWSLLLFQKIYDAMEYGGMLLTYCAKGQFKRDLRSVGFTVEGLPGPPGKREITRATKSFC